MTFHMLLKSTLSTYADDTQIFYADNDLPRVEEPLTMILLVLINGLRKME